MKTISQLIQQKKNNGTIENGVEGTPNVTQIRKQ